MALDVARRTSIGEPKRPSKLSWVDHLNFSRLRDRPRWLSLLLLTSAVYALMPMVYLQLFGVERVSVGIARDIESLLGIHISRMTVFGIQGDLAERSIAATCVLNFALSASVVLLTGLCLHVGALLLGLEVSAAQALAVASVAAFGCLALTLAEFALACFTLGLDDAARMDWVRVARADLSLMTDTASSAIWRTFLGMFDAIRAANVLIGAVGLRAMDPRAGWTRAVLGSLGWFLVVGAYRVAFSATFGFPMIWRRATAA